MAVSGTALPSFSVIVEWENAGRSQRWRHREMLRRLFAQIAELQGRLDTAPQVLLVYDPDDASAEALEECRSTLEELDTGKAEVRRLAVSGARYYELKNHGARVATGELLLFLDIDCLPEDGWLRALLEPFERPEVDALAGVSRLGPRDGFFEKAMTLIWFLPLPPRGDEPEFAPAVDFFAHNLAIRRRVFAAHPFPDRPTFRGQCQHLARELLREGFGVYRVQSARILHPAPNGFGHFAARALSKGHDRVAGKQGPRGRAMLRALDRWRRELVRAARRIARGRRRVGLGRLGACASFGVAFAYWSIALLGSWITILDPALLPRRLQV